MLDLKLIQNFPKDVLDGLQKRGIGKESITDIQALNEVRIKLLQQVEAQRGELKKLAKEIGQLMKTKKTDEAIAKKNAVSQMKNDLVAQEQQLEEAQASIENKLLHLPNIPDQEVPIGKSEEDNQVVSQWKTPPEFSYTPKDHIELGEDLKMLDFETAAKMTGARFSLLYGDLASLERALINFMIEFHLKRGYQEVAPPYLVHEKSMVGTGQLPKFKDDAFQIENRPWYLIPTSEVPLTNILREKISHADDFPKKFVSFSPCFRSEAGSYGKDVKGLIRLHQFLKVEMVQITKSEESELAHQEMRQSGRELLELLELPYREVLLCSGDMGFTAAKTYDLEVWLPAQNCYREISSISNCRDFQARRAKIRYRDSGGEIQFAHTLNGSGLAVGRTLVAILENFQQENGDIVLPKVLHQWMGKEKIEKK